MLPTAHCLLPTAFMRRPERVADILRDEISQIVGYELEDPRLTVVTVTDVRLSENRRDAQVFVIIAGNEEEHQLALTALRKAAPYIRKQLSLSLNLPRTPEIHFVRDTVEEHGARVDRLLQQLAEEQKEEEGMKDQEV